MSSSSSFGGKSFGGKNPFATDAAAAKLRDEFARLKKSGKGAMDEGLASRGIFSSGVGARLQSEQDTQYGLAEGAALEGLFNNAEQQRMAWEMEQQRMQMEQQRAMAGGGFQRGTYEGGNHSQGGTTGVAFGSTSAPGYNTGGGNGHPTGPGVAGGSTGGGGVDPRGQGSLELARAYYRATGKYGTAADHAAWANNTYGYTVSDPGVAFNPIG